MAYNLNCKLTSQALDEFFIENDGISDMDMTYNPDTGEFDLPAIEWDNCRGSWWQRFSSEAERIKAIDEHNAFQKRWIDNRVAELRREKKLRKQQFEATRNTLGNLCPDAFKTLKSLL